MKSSQQLWQDIQDKKAEYGDQWLEAWLLKINTEVPKLMKKMDRNLPF